MSQALRRSSAMAARPLNFFEILRLGLAQAALGAMIVITTSVLNRVMMVELALPGMAAGAFLGVYYATQALRPHWGHRLDGGGAARRWIVGGLSVLAAGGVTAAIGVATQAESFALGAALTALGYLMVGVGGGASGTTVLAFLALRTAPERRAEAASLTWIMMIAGIIISSILVSIMIEPFSLRAMVSAAAVISAGALAIGVLAVATLDDRMTAEDRRAAAADGTPFWTAMRAVWADPDARVFTIFVFVSMLAYNFQELILEPYGGSVFGLTPAETTRLTAAHNGGVLAGMVLTPLVGRLRGGWRAGELKTIVILGCMGSGLCLGVLASLGGGAGWALGGLIGLLGLANGVFAVAAISVMMALAGAGARGSGRGGARMGLWGAAQGVAFGVGGVSGALAVDFFGAALRDGAAGYAAAFGFEAALFVVAAFLAARVGVGGVGDGPAPIAPTPEASMG